MKISDVRKVLERVQEEHGDIDFVLNDPDTERLFSLNEKNFKVFGDDRKRLEVTADYCGEYYDV